MTTATFPSDSVLGYTEPLIEWRSPAFFPSIAKFTVWFLAATLVPVLVAAIWILAMNWCNYDPSFYNGTMYSGVHLFFLVASLLGGALVASAIIGFVIFWSLLGMLAAFSEPH